MLQTSRKGKGLGEVIEERSSGLLKNTGIVLVQQKKNLIIICRGWQCGIWLVEMVSAMLNSWFEFLGQCFPFVLRWRGKNSGTHRPVRVCVCLLVAWTASHCNGHTHSPFPSFRPGRKVISSGGFCWLSCCLFTFQSPPRRVSWADPTGLKINCGASFQLSPCPDSFLQVQLAHRSRFTDSYLHCCRHFRFLNKN